MSDNQLQYSRFGRVGAPTSVMMRGRKGGTTATDTGSVLDVSAFSAGNLSNSLYTQKKINENLVDAGSDPNVRSYVQQMIQPKMSIDANGHINVAGSRVTSGEGVRDGGSAGTLNHEGIDANRDGGGTGATFYSPIAGWVLSAGDPSPTNAVVIEDTEGNRHTFMHGADLQVKTKQFIEVGTPLGTVSNQYQGVSIPAHLHYQIKDANGKEVRVEDYAATHPLPAQTQQVVDLPNGGGTLTLKVGQIDVDTAGGQHYAFDLNATNVRDMRVQDGNFSVGLGGGIRAQVDLNSTESGGKLIIPCTENLSGVEIPFGKNGLVSYGDGSIMAASTDGQLHLLEPALDSHGGFAWTERTMSSDQARQEFGQDIKLPEVSAPLTSQPVSEAASEELTAVQLGRLDDGSNTKIYTVALETVDVNGVTYQLAPNGALMRTLPGGDTEWRNPETFEGVVTDWKGEDKTSISANEEILLSDNEQGYAVLSIQNPTTSTLPTSSSGTDYADAGGGGVTPVTPTLPTPAESINTLNNYLEANPLTPSQQQALAAQLDHLNLGNDKALSFYTLPDGGALIATADGDIVGEINRSSTGDLNLKASAIDASGETVKVRQYINEQRQSLSTKNSQAKPHKDTSITVSTFTIFCLVSSLQLRDDLVKRAMQVLRRCLFCGVFLMPPAIWAQNNAHQEQVQPLLFNALKEQRFSAAYKKVFEPYLGLKWVYFGSGPTSPAEKKTLKSGEVIYIYSTCRPHACDAEYLYFVYAPSSGAGWGGVSIQSDIESISSTSTELTSILSNLLGPKK